MTVNILMPALSPTMESGKLAKWLKSAGDPVKAGDVVAEIETDKATMEVEAVDEGVLARILVPEGTENVAVNTPIAVIALEGEAVTDPAPAAPPAPAPAAPAPATTAAPERLLRPRRKRRPRLSMSQDLPRRNRRRSPRFRPELGCCR